MESWKEGGMKEDDFLLMATAEHSQRTSYATGKLLTEFFVKDVVDKGLIKGCSLRFANVYSRNELLTKHIVPHVISSLIYDGTVTLLENSKVNKRTFCIILTVARQLGGLIHRKPWMVLFIMWQQSEEVSF